MLENKDANVAAVVAAVAALLVVVEVELPLPVLINDDKFKPETVEIKLSTLAVLIIPLEAIAPAENSL